jgi:tRNA pseudouridine32 synthase/23S rRNA pseudouridine746 synthase
MQPMYRIIENHPDFILVSKFHDVDFHNKGEAIGLVQKIRQDMELQQLYPVHRLDSMTSGLIVLAKNKESAQEFAASFREHRVEKFYIALGGTHPRKKQGTIIGDMKKVRDGKWILCHSRNNPAITQFFSSGLGNGLRLYILRLLTGKTHQIRVALKSLGAPILGDPLYSKKNSGDLIVDRGYLHSYAMGFVLKGKYYRYKDIPEKGVHFCSQEFKNALRKYEDPWVTFQISKV